MGSVNLTSLQITNLESDSFRNLTQLFILDLGSNRLTCLVHSNLFKDLIDLRVLYLDGNQLYSLDSYLFRNLTNLNQLHLEYNQLTKLSSPLFSSLSRWCSLRHWW
jgi:Leucine-rich repeat (LRR) protein